MFQALIENKTIAGNTAPKCATCGHLKWLREGLVSCQDPTCKAHKARVTRSKRKTKH